MKDIFSDFVEKVSLSNWFDSLPNVCLRGIYNMGVYSFRKYNQLVLK